MSEESGSKHIHEVLSVHRESGHVSALSQCPSDYSTQRHLGREEVTPSHHPSPQNLSHQAMILSVLLALRDSVSEI